MKSDRKEFYKLCYEKWGEESQVVKSIEEMNELSQELCKYYRYVKLERNEEKLKGIITNIKEEIADALNMLEQMQYILGFEEIEKIRDEKIKRTYKLKFDK